jgi:hypothetical protein
VTRIEELAATAQGYQRADDMLSIERLILAAMHPREPETRTHVMAQMGRVSALEEVVATFARALTPDDGEVKP